MVLNKQTLARMINCRSAAWSDDVAVLDLLGDAIGVTSLSKSARNSLKEMLDEGLNSGHIRITSERMRVLFLLRNKCDNPTPKECAAAAKNLHVGAANHNVLNQPWIQDALNILNSIAKSSINKGDESDD